MSHIAGLHADVSSSWCCRDYLHALELYRQRIWTCAASGKSGLTYEEALTNESLSRSLSQPVRLPADPTPFVYPAHPCMGLYLLHVRATSVCVQCEQQYKDGRHACDCSVHLAGSFRRRWRLRFAASRTTPPSGCQSCWARSPRRWRPASSRARGCWARMTAVRCPAASSAPSHRATLAPSRWGQNAQHSKTSLWCPSHHCAVLGTQGMCIAFMGSVHQQDASEAVYEVEWIIDGTQGSVFTQLPASALVREQDASCVCHCLSVVRTCCR